MIQLVLLAAGVIVVVIGVALIHLPAALIVAGLAVATFALLWDFRPDPKGGNG